jgi:peptidoglycan lytic transglycosylase
MGWGVVGILALSVVGCGAEVHERVSAPAAGQPGPVSARRTAKRALFANAQRRYAAGDCAGALPLLEQLQPSYVELEDYVLYYLASCRERAGDFDAALALWTRLSTTQARSVFAPDAALESGRIWHSRGDAASARSSFEIAHDTGDGGVRRAATFELAELDIAAGDLVRAHDRLMELRRAVPGTSLDRRAKQRVEEIRRRDPTLVPRGSDRDAEVDLLRREGNYDEAIALAQAILPEAEPSRRANLLRSIAEARRAEGRFDEALATLREIAQRYPDTPAAPNALYRYAVLLWNRDRDEEALPALVQYLRRYPNGSRSAEALYAVGRIEQTAQREEDAIRSYERLASRYPTAAQAREARWRIGWIRYQQGRWRDAAAIFGALEGRTTAAGADARYWRARALERAGDDGAAREIYEQILERAPDSYYAQWAERRLHVASQPAAATTAADLEAVAIGPPPGEAVQRYHYVRARELQAAGLKPLARVELRRFERDNPLVPAMSSYLIQTYPAVDGYRDAIRIAYQDDQQRPEVLYPLAFWPLVRRDAAAQAVDPYLVLALMRQESLFDPAARSPANARGLMQLLPGTADRVARQAGIPTPVADLYDPKTNVALGTAYLGSLLHDYGGDELKALAAYNGGEAAVAKWEERFGNLAPDEFVESISYRETREYVKKVISNYRRYEQQYR